MFISFSTSSLCWLNLIYCIHATFKSFLVFCPAAPRICYLDGEFFEVSKKFMLILQSFSDLRTFLSMNIVSFPPFHSIFSSRNLDSEPFRLSIKVALRLCFNILSEREYFYKRIYNLPKSINNSASVGKFGFFIAVQSFLHKKWKQ